MENEREEKRRTREQCRSQLLAVQSQSTTMKFCGAVRYFALYGFIFYFFRVFYFLEFLICYSSLIGPRQVKTF